MASDEPEAKRPRTGAKGLESLRWDSKVKTLAVLDQLRIPHESIYIDVKTSKDAWQVIRTMQVRGAPLIGIVAMLGLAAEIQSGASKFPDANEAAAWLKQQLDYLQTSRPTAVNLTNYAALLGKQASVSAGLPGATSSSVLEKFVSGAEELLKQDLEDNIAIGDRGAEAVMESCGKSNINVLTVCNTGSLATAGYGTALGVVRSLYRKGALKRVYACETRPYNQGARLTAFEIVKEEMPGTLICDNMAAFLMKKGEVDAVVVGCDRIARNGDFANKIGTYSLAVSAKHHGVPFFVAGVSGTIDSSMESGDAIPIEERPPNELTHISTPGGPTIQIAPSGIEVWNPAFDVTPGLLVEAIITEQGVFKRGNGQKSFNLGASAKA
jgi:S-methyl-5-thioribose-1-phosphate isomerase